MTMTAPSSIDQFVDLIKSAKIVDDARLAAFHESVSPDGKSPSQWAERLVQVVCRGSQAEVGC